MPKGRESTLFPEDDRIPPGQLFFKISEVARITDERPHVLRFWETQFPALAPRKLPGGHRQYRRKDIKMVLTIKALLREHGLTIAGARRALRRDRRQSAPAAQQGTAPGGLESAAQMQLFQALPSGVIEEIKAELEEILDLLRG